MWSIIWAFIPARYLYGATALVALGVSGIVALKMHDGRLKSSYFEKGRAYAADSAQMATIARLQAVRDSAAHVSDSLAKVAKRGDSLLAIKPGLEHAPPRIEHIDSLVPTVPISNLVAIYVAADPTTPHYADRYIANLVVWYDSVVYKQLLPQRDSAIVIALRWKNAWGAEHSAREGADSLAAAYAERLRAVELVPRPSNMHRIAYLAAGVVGFLIAKRVH